MGIILNEQTCLGKCKYHNPFAKKYKLLWLPWKCSFLVLLLSICIVHNMFLVLLCFLLFLTKKRPDITNEEETRIKHCNLILHCSHS